MSKSAVAALSRTRSQSSGANAQKSKGIGNGGIAEGQGVRSSYSQATIQGNLVTILLTLIPHHMHNFYLSNPFFNMNSLRMPLLPWLSKRQSEEVQYP